MEVLKTHVSFLHFDSDSTTYLTYSQSSVGSKPTRHIERCIPKDMVSWTSGWFLSRADSLGMQCCLLSETVSNINNVSQAWLEASTKGAILIVASSEVEYHARTKLNASPTVCGVLGGISGGIAQSYLTMGMTTCMKTVEVTRTKIGAQGARVPGTMEMFFSILREKGIRGVNRGVNAVALRQVTGWSSRIGISRFAEESIRSITGKSEKEKLKFGEKILASTIGGALSCWNQPFEVSFSLGWMK